MVWLMLLTGSQVALPHIEMESSPLVVVLLNPLGQLHADIYVLGHRLPQMLLVRDQQSPRQCETDCGGSSAIKSIIGRASS
jgi:hypothetical protein